MFSPIVGIFGTWLALAGMCQAGIFERPNLAPLSIVYTVYPYYNSETLLGIFTPEEPETPKGQETGSSGESSDSSGDNEASSESTRREADLSRDDAATEITYWPPVQRGAAPKPRSARTTVLQSSNFKKNV